MANIKKGAEIFIKSSDINMQELFQATVTGL